MVRKKVDVTFEDLKLDEKTMGAVMAAGLTVSELIDFARNDVVWRTYRPRSVFSSEWHAWIDGPNRLLLFSGIDKYCADMIIKAVDEAGFILHESDESCAARRLLASICGGVGIFIEHYDDLEDMSSEATAAVDAILDLFLRSDEVAVIRLRYGFEDGQMHTLDECSARLDISRERVRQIEYDAIARLWRPDIRKGLEVAILYSREALARKVARLQSDIVNLQSELDALTDFNPYPDLTIEEGRVLSKADSLSVSLAKCNLSARAQNSLARVGIHTVGDLLDFTDSDLLYIRNFGKVSLDEVHNLLSTLGFTLRVV